ncbi:uncharacterized protein LOC130936562 [Arachis stenosperma]|uniref:uncharacterized protein LOC130936562 n=1 Tax=Arachis stenosperma TaxID=217475 RepID=UPI0025AB6BAC|nr:uncharacterized protein LOC130936562 [Arachis stenosperma]
MGDRETSKSHVVSMAARQTGLPDYMAQFLHWNKDSFETPSANAPSSPAIEVQSQLAVDVNPMTTVVGGVGPVEEVFVEDTGPKVAIVKNPLKRKATSSLEGMFTVPWVI